MSPPKTLPHTMSQPRCLRITWFGFGLGLGHRRARLDGHVAPEARPDPSHLIRDRVRDRLGGTLIPYP